MKPRDLAAYLFLTLVWGLSFLVLLHVSLAFGWVGAVTFRALVAALVLMLLARLTGRRLDFGAGWLPFTAVGATTVAGQLIGFSYATPRIGTAMSAILLATVPLFSMVIGRLWGLERLAPQGVAGLVLGILGIALLVGAPAVPVTETFLTGCAAALFGAVSAAFGSNYASRRLADADPWAIAAGSFLAGGLLTLPLLVAVPLPRWPGLADIGHLLILGCIMSALCYVLYFGLVAAVGATRAISVEFPVTVVAVIIGAVLLHEPLSALQYAGAAIIILGCALVLGLIPRRRLDAERPAA